MAQQFGHIFKPLQLKHGATLRNRIVMGTCVQPPSVKPLRIMNDASSPVVEAGVVCTVI